MLKYFFHPETDQQTESIESKHDLCYTRKEIDKVTAKKPVNIWKVRLIKKDILIKI